MLALPVRARCDRLNGTVHEVYRCLLGIRLASRMLKTRCRRPTSRHPCPDRGTAEPSCTPPTCAACGPSTRASHPAPTLPGRDHSRSPSTREHMCPLKAPLTVGAHALGPYRRLTSFEETTFGAISTCMTASFQRYHTRVVLLPCVVAISCRGVVFSRVAGVWPMVARLCCS